MGARDGHVRVLPIHVANKIAAGEVVERPASVVKELVENSIDAGARNIRITITQGGRRLVSVQDDGCGMTRDDAVLSLERQATSKILDVDDIERIDTLGFRGEAIPSIASVSRFTITTRRAEADEGTFVQVNAGTLAEVRAAGCPPGTLVEVRDLFCNVPARRKFLRAYATEEMHVKSIFTVHALAYPQIGFSLAVDGRELYRLAPSATLAERIREMFGDDYLGMMSVLPETDVDGVRVRGYIERPNPAAPSRREQYVFINGRPATAPSVAYALKTSYPRQQGDVRPAAIIFIDTDPSAVDVNVHPTKREVRFRDNSAVKNALSAAVEAAIRPAAPSQAHVPATAPTPAPAPAPVPASAPTSAQAQSPAPTSSPSHVPSLVPFSTGRELATPAAPAPSVPSPAPAPVQVEFAVDPGSATAKPWKYFRYLAYTDSGYLLVETDAGIVTVNPVAARERIVYERLQDSRGAPISQTLLIPETVKLPPAEAARIKASLDAVASTGFAIEEFGRDVFKVDAVPLELQDVSVSDALSAIARDLAENPGRRTGETWRSDLVAKSVAKSCAGRIAKLDEKLGVKLVEELSACRSPYVTPRGKPIMLFRSTRELRRRFAQE
ncbi:MAG: DNA mismatch repair endonuclease MutL [Lentisphaerae bacterium]|nr:DNA mismatch repair endonuclease MutL [Lentisphaerota bacterium]